MYSELHGWDFSDETRLQDFPLCWIFLVGKGAAHVYRLFCVYSDLGIVPPEKRDDVLHLLLKCSSLWWGWMIRQTSGNVLGCGFGVCCPLRILIVVDVLSLQEESVSVILPHAVRLLWPSETSKLNTQMALWTYRSHPFLSCASLCGFHRDTPNV